MDFARRLIDEESAVTRSNIKYLPIPAAEEDNESTSPSSSTPSIIDGNTGDDNSEDKDKDSDSHHRLRWQLIRSANRAAAHLFGEEDERNVDASKYPDRLFPQPNQRDAFLIQAGDLVVLQLAFDNLDFVYVTPGKNYQNRNGRFPHESFIGLPYGSKVRSSDHRGYGFLYLLKPTPELWVRSLVHRTQIVHELDASQIVFQLYLKPNMMVAESGTGSAGLSHSIARSIAPFGRLHTYEFNQTRAETAMREFDRNGVSHLVTVHHVDVCTEGFVGLSDASVDAVSLDLPEPWRAVTHAARIMKHQARISTYSPCIEQSQRTVIALQECGFHCITTMEYRLKEYYVDEVNYAPPPTAKRPKLIRDTRYDHGFPEEFEKSHDIDGNDNHDIDDVNRASTEFDNHNHPCVDVKDESAASSVTSAVASGNHNPITASTVQLRRMLVARPFVTMRGHSAFLTFATLGRKRKPAES